MKRHIRSLLILWFGIAVVTASPAGHAAAPEPDVLVRANTTKILELIKTNRDAYAEDNTRLYAMVDEYVLPHFDFRAMSRLVLGRYWREANEDQRERFTRAFRALLVRTYATALLKYNDEEIVYLPFNAKPGDKTVVVRTEVRQAGGGAPIPMHFSFYTTDNGWKVYDVTIEGVSLVTNYRSTYADKIRTEGLEALIASIASSKRDGPEGKSGAQKSSASR